MKKLRKPRDIKGAYITPLNTKIFIEPEYRNLKDMKRLHKWLSRVIKFMEQK
jgi:hypothetical protein